VTGGKGLLSQHTAPLLSTQGLGTADTGRPLYRCQFQPSIDAPFPPKIPELRDHARQIAARGRAAALKALAGKLSHFVVSAGRALLNQARVPGVGGGAAGCGRPPCGSPRSAHRPAPPLAKLSECKVAIVAFPLLLELEQQWQNVVMGFHVAQLDPNPA
jgi:hypothetical protein